MADDEFKEKEIRYSNRKEPDTRRKTKTVGIALAALLAVTGVLAWGVWKYRADPRSPDISRIAVNKSAASVRTTSAPTGAPKPTVPDTTKIEPAIDGRPVTPATDVPPPELKEPPKAEATTAPTRPTAPAKNAGAGKRAKPEPRKPAVAAPASPVDKNAKGEFVWRRFGVAPAYASRAEAMRDRERAFRNLGVAECAIPELLKATEKPGARILLGHGDRLGAMLSKGGVVHQNVTIDFEKPPTQGMAYAAWAESWTVVCEGKSHEVILPAVCNNWSVRTTVLPVVAKALPPAPAEPACVEVSFNAKPRGQVRWGILSPRGPLAPECNAQRQGNGPWLAWYGRCDDCAPVDTPHSYLYGVTDARQTIRFSRSVLSATIYLCLEDGEWNQSCSVRIRPEDWKGKARVEIPDQLWRFGGDCPE